MIDEHTRVSLLNLVERSITGEALVAELAKVFAAHGGPPKVLHLDNGPEMVSQALQHFCKGRLGMTYIPPGCPPSTPALGAGLQDAGRVRCRMQVHPHPTGLQHQLSTDQARPDSRRTQ